MSYFEMLSILFFFSSDNIKELDIQGTQLTSFPRDWLLGLKQLRFVSTDNEKLCCPQVLPDSVAGHRCNCSSSWFLSSCNRLIMSQLVFIFPDIVSLLFCYFQMLTLTCSNRLQIAYSGLGKSDSSYQTHLAVLLFLHDPTC